MRSSYNNANVLYDLIEHRMVAVETSIGSKVSDEAFSDLCDLCERMKAFVRRYMDKAGVSTRARRLVSDILRNYHVIEDLCETLGASGQIWTKECMNPTDYTVFQF